MNDDYLKSEEYKQKYEDLMKRCSDFMRDFAPPSPYELGFKAGWEAAKQEFHKDNTYVPDTTKPARTMDLQWPRDRTTNPWPPSYEYKACSRCAIDLNKNNHYVCMLADCPSRIGWVLTKTTTGTTL